VGCARRGSAVSQRQELARKCGKMYFLLFSELVVISFPGKERDVIAIELFTNPNIPVVVRFFSNSRIRDLYWPFTVVALRITLKSSGNLGKFCSFAFVRLPPPRPAPLGGGSPTVSGCVYTLSLERE